MRSIRFKFKKLSKPLKKGSDGTRDLSRLTVNCPAAKSDKVLLLRPANAKQVGIQSLPSAKSPIPDRARTSLSRIFRSCLCLRIEPHASENLRPLARSGTLRSRNRLQFGISRTRGTTPSEPFVRGSWVFLLYPTRFFDDHGEHSWHAQYRKYGMRLPIFDAEPPRLPRRFPLALFRHRVRSYTSLRTRHLHTAATPEKFTFEALLHFSIFPFHGFSVHPDLVRDAPFSLRSSLLDSDLRC